MITEENILPDLTPAFNKNLLEVSSDETFREKYSYILDVLLDEFFAQYMSDAGTGYPDYSGYAQITGSQGAEQYSIGDRVMVFNLTNGNFNGIHRVRHVPNQTTIILDSVWNGISVFLGEIWVFKIKRNKLPVNPNGNAVFNVNNFGAGEVGLHYKATDFGMFNIPENFKRYKYLAHEEYYEPIGFTSFGGFTGAGFTNIARVLGATSLPEVGDVIVITQNRSN